MSDSQLSDSEVTEFPNPFSAVTWLQLLGTICKSANSVKRRHPLDSLESEAPSTKYSQKYVCLHIGEISFV
uniref:Uncharacterized protein n=1 Tax=Romanomermis culicivorax TaxID=13658 RepID=A0A915LCB5_ROMCU